jgi:hypothetical protein
MGDSERLIEEEFHMIFDLLKNNDYDLFITNGRGLFPNKENRLYTDVMTFLYEEVVGISLVSRYIFYEDMVNKGNFWRYYNTDFVHVGVSIEYLLSLNSTRIFCYNRNSFTVSVTPDRLKTAWLLSDALNVLEGSFWLFMSIPNLPNVDKLPLLRKFSACICKFDFFYWRNVTKVFLVEIGRESQVC